MLASRDTDFLGKVAYNRGFYDRAVEWFQQTLAFATAEGLSSNLTKVLRNQLKATIRTHDKTLDQKGRAGSVGAVEWRTNRVPFDEKLRKKKKFKNVSAKEETFSPSLGRSNQPHIVSEQFNRLCRGEELRSPLVTKELKCESLHYHQPYLKLGPFKADTQSLVPHIVVFRDLVSQHEISHFRRVATQNGLARSQHGMPLGKGGSGSSVKRTSKQTWLGETAGVNGTHWSIGPYQTREHLEPRDRIAMGISDRISLATKLYNMEHGGGEPFQIANYGIGGVYNHHPDPHGYHRPERPVREGEGPSVHLEGDRVATVMAYISRVSLGGGTVFPNAGVAIQPEEGSAAFWWNLHTNGWPDQLTIHGGCPVLVGSKWITNKWVRWHAQAFKFPCRRRVLEGVGGYPGFERQPVTIPLIQYFIRAVAIHTLQHKSLSVISHLVVPLHVLIGVLLAVVEKQVVPDNREVPQDELSSLLHGPSGYNYFFVHFIWSKTVLLP